MGIKKKTMHERTLSLVLMALFVALAYACQLVFRIKVSFLTFDAKDAVLTIGAMFFGPLAGAGMAFTVSLIEMITVSDTAFWGFVMNFCGSAAFACTASWIYRYAPRVKKTLAGAVIGLCAADAVMTAVMLLLNLFVTPLYMGVERSQVVSMIPTLLLPFNVVKALLNASLTLVLYKPVSHALYRTGVMGKKAPAYRLDKKTLAVTLAGSAAAIACVIVLLFVLDGKL